MASSGSRTQLDHYDVIAHIGKGSFGTVSKIHRKADGRQLVWKELNYGTMREKEKQLVVSEVNILRELRHPFVVRYYDRIVEKSKQKLYIVMEFCEGGDLGALIKKCKRDGTAIDEEFIWRVFSQITMALTECHRHHEKGALKPILHRDLKPQNIFLDTSRNVKIGDFGLAKELASKSKFATTNVGTPFYMSPEMINETEYNEKSDIWALGCLIYELAALCPPFDATNHLTLAVKINAGKFPRIPSRYSDDLHRAIRWMLQKDISKRPSVEELERLPRMTTHMREAKLIVKEYSMSQAYSSKWRELARREEDLRRREAAVAERESVVAEHEAKLGIAPAHGEGHMRRKTMGTLREQPHSHHERRPSAPSSVDTTSTTSSVQPPPLPRFGGVAGGGGMDAFHKRQRRTSMQDVTPAAVNGANFAPTGQL